ncbi:hypothetical protein [Embleya sp. AB8]|uniref:hypothetical protein n=1 Tax=Embleya sp. AB8 TaxID=3156304 RepID=UPI003C724C6F
MSEAKITNLTVKDHGVRVTVVVEGPRPDVVRLEKAQDLNQLILLLGPVATKPQPAPQVGGHPLIELVSTIGSVFDRNRPNELGMAVNILTTRPVELRNVALTQDDSDANVTRYHLDMH